MKKSLTRIAMLLLCATVICFGGFSAWAADNVRPADVSEPSAGNVFLGMEGSFNGDAAIALARINEIRMEACREGLRDPRDPSRNLTVDDYVPMTWSQALEYISRIRSAEASVTLAHARLNGQSIYTVLKDGVRMYGECLAWNHGDDIVSGVDQWYGEKEYWVTGVVPSGRSDGHYKMMINPDFTKIGLSSFTSSETSYPNTVQAAFSYASTSVGDLGSNPLSPENNIIQTVEVNESSITSYVLNCPDTVGETSNGKAFVNAMVKGVAFVSFDEYSYTSSDSSVATVGNDGTITGVAKGKCTIKAYKGSELLGEKEIEVTCNHQWSWTYPAAGRGTKTCTECGAVTNYSLSVYSTDAELSSSNMFSGMRDKTVKSGSHLYFNTTLTEDGKSVGSSVILTSSDESIATTGAERGYKKITFNKPGTVTVTVASALYPEIKRSYTVTITHDHEYGSEWVSDGTQHWHECSCGDKSDVSSHSAAEVVDAKYLKSEANCTSKAVYYKSCSVCGAKLNATFESGDVDSSKHVGGTKTVGAAEVSCTEDGYTGDECCAGCDAVLVKGTVISAKGHMAIEKVDAEYLKSEANCVSKAVYFKSCSVCGEKLSETFVNGDVDSSKHVGGTKVVGAAEASCTEEGYTGDECCASCDAVLVKGKSIAVKEHTATEKVDAKYLKSEANCTAKAVYFKSCSVCGEKLAETFESGEVDSSKHVGGTKTVGAAEESCTEDGYTGDECCAGCDAILKKGETITAKGHTAAEKTADKYLKQEGNCSEGSTYYKSCSVCGEKLDATFNDGIPLPDKHVGGTTIRDQKEATCTQSGFTGNVYCAGCGTGLEAGSVIPVKEHTATEKVDVKYLKSEANCTAKAVYFKSCSVCGEKLDETFESGEVDKTKHVGGTKTVGVTEANCTEDGYTGDECCASCGDVLVKGKIIPAKGHQLAEKADAKYLKSEANCVAKAVYFKSCSACGETLEETFESGEVDPSKHTGNTRIEGKLEATEEAEGYTGDTICEDCEVVIAAGEIIPVKPATPANPIIRIFGNSRYDTTMGAADKLLELQHKDKFDCIIVACGSNYPDALAGSYLAKKKDAPIVLVDKSVEAKIGAYIRSKLSDGGRVYILGGTGAVSAAFEKNQLKGLDVKRLQGNNRYETNIAILKEAGVNGEDLLICTGSGYADSLSASATGLPILLVGDKLNSQQKNYLAQISIGKSYAIGGTGVIKQPVVNEVDAVTGVKSERVAGANRYKTSVAVAETFFGFNCKTVVLSYAQNFPDGLSGGPVAMALNAPMVLTSNDSSSDASAYSKKTGCKTVYVFGGPKLISDAVAKSCIKA